MFVNITRSSCPCAGLAHPDAHYIPALNVLPVMRYLNKQACNEHQGALNGLGTKQMSCVANYDT